MSTHVRRGPRLLAVVAVLAFVAAACGSRVSGEQVDSEAAEDAQRAGVAGLAAGVVGAGGAAGGTGTAAAGSTEAATGGGGTGASGGAGISRGGAVGAGSGAVAPTQPEGGNGGATDVGVTESTIKVGNVATLTGPVPGLFRGALVATQAYFAYINSQGGVHGRVFEVVSADDALDQARNRAQHQELQDDVFAFVGSFSVADGGGGKIIQETGVPDIGRGLELDRINAKTHYSPIPEEPGWSLEAANYYKKTYGVGVISKTALFTAAVDAARLASKWQKEAYSSVGYKFIYEREVQPNTVNFTGDILEMQRQGVQNVMFQGDVGNMARLTSAMKQQGFTPPLRNLGAAAYDSNFIKLAGADAANGIILDGNLALYLGGDADRVPEVARFLEWMAKIDPNQPIDLFGLYGWDSAKLFVHALTQAGPEAKRSTLLAELSGIHAWDGDGIQAVADVGRRRFEQGCNVVIEIKGGEYTRKRPAEGFACGPIYRIK